MTKFIRQEGIVLSHTDQSVKVQISCKSACAGCHARSACSSLDQTDKVLDIRTPHPDSYAAGELIWVRMNPKMGLKAVFYAYVLPFVIFIIALIVSIQVSNNELVSSILSLGAIAVYYFFLYFMRSKLTNSFTFVLQKFDRHV